MQGFTVELSFCGLEPLFEMVGYLAGEILLSGVEAAIHSFFHSPTQSHYLLNDYLAQRKALPKKELRV